MAAVRLFVGGLAFTTSTDGLREAFARFGPVQSAAVMTDRETGRSRGFGFVEMGSEEEAEKAISGLNGSSLDGRMIRVDRATPRGAGGPRPAGGAPARRPRGGGGRPPRGRAVVAPRVPAVAGLRRCPKDVAEPAGAEAVAIDVRVSRAAVSSVGRAIRRPGGSRPHPAKSAAAVVGVSAPTATTAGGAERRGSRQA